MISLQSIDVLSADSHLLRLGIVVLGSVTLALISNFIYNAFFHPLSSYPGPKLWAGTRLITFYHSVRGDLVYQIDKMHKQYGPVVRVAPTELSYTTGSAWKTIYGHRKIEMPKPLDGRGGILPPAGGGHSLVTANREDHTRMRRLVAHAFSEKALREQESFIQNYASQLIESLRKYTAQSPIQDMVKWFNFTTFEVIGDLAFGEPFGTLKSGTADTMMESIIATVKSTPWHHFALYYNLGKFLQTLIIPAPDKNARIKNFKESAAKMDRRLATEEDRKDFTSYMLKHNDDKGMSLQELRNMSVTLLIAGSETTASLLSGATFYMLKNKHAYEKLCGEVRGKFTTDEEITMSAANELKYMLAVLEEGLRMYPPAPGTFPRMVPGAGEEIDGRWVPAGTAVGVHQLSAYRSETNFRRASEFIPERWQPEAEGGSTEFANDDTTVFQPFSTGPRNCVGKNLAYAEMRIVLARLLFNFDLELDPSCTDWANHPAPFLWDKQPLMVKLTPRQTAQ